VIVSRVTEPKRRAGTVTVADDTVAIGGLRIPRNAAASV